RVTLNLRFAISPLEAPFALTRCDPPVAFSGIKAWTLKAPSESARILLRRIVPWVESTNLSATNSSGRKPDPWTCTTVPGGPECGRREIVAENRGFQYPPSHVHVSPR